MEKKSSNAAETIADLQQARAFDKPSHDRLMATVAALQGARLLPKPDQRILFSALPDLHVLLAEGLSGPMYGQAPARLGANAQARGIRDLLLTELQRPYHS